MSVAHFGRWVGLVASGYGARTVRPQGQLGEEVGEGGEVESALPGLAQHWLWQRGWCGAQPSLLRPLAVAGRLDMAHGLYFAHP